MYQLKYLIVRMNGSAIRVSGILLGKEKYQHSNIDKKYIEDTS